MEESKEELTLFDTDETGKQEPLIDQPPGEPEQEQDAITIAKNIFEMTQQINNSQLVKVSKSFAEISKIITEQQEQIQQMPAPLQEAILLRAFEGIAKAAALLRQDFIALGVEGASLAEATALFNEAVIENDTAFVDVLNLARELKKQEQYKDLKLIDLAQAINSDLSVDPASPYFEILDKCLIEARKVAHKSSKEKARAEAVKQTRAAGEQAKSMGALLTLDNRLATFTKRGLMQGFTSQNIYYVEDIGKEPGQFDEQGQLQKFDLAFTELEQIHTQLFEALCQAAILMYDPQSPDKQDTTITLYLPTICRELGIDGRKAYSTGRKAGNLKQQRVQRFIDIIKPFEKYVGRTPKGIFSRVLVFREYDEKSDTITVDIPYMYRLLEHATEKLKGKDLSLALDRLIHADVFSKYTSTAVELAARMLAGVKQRGLRKHNNEDRITITPKYQTLVADCPQLLAKINAIKLGNSNNKRQAINSVLKSTFEAAFKILLENSDVKNYYLDFRIEPIGKNGKPLAPTNSSLKNILTISHLGKNPNYDPQNNL